MLLIQLAQISDIDDDEIVYMNDYEMTLVILEGDMEEYHHDHM